MDSADLTRRNRELNDQEFQERRLVLQSRPTHLNLVLTNQCRLNCLMCRARQRGDGALPAEAVRKLFTMFPYVQGVQWHGGEVFELDYFRDLFAETAPFGHIEHSFITNALSIDEGWADLLARRKASVACSVDSVHPATYESIRRGARFVDLLASLERMAQARKAPGCSLSLDLTAVVMRRNFREMPDFPGFCRRYGFRSLHLQALWTSGEAELEKEDVLLDAADDATRAECAALVAETERRCQTQGIHFSCNFRDRLPRAGSAPAATSAPRTGAPAKPTCPNPWRMLHVNWLGDIFPAPECRRNVGNLGRDTWESAWNSQAMQDYRQAISEGWMPEICSRECLAVRGLPGPAELGGLTSPERIEVYTKQKRVDLCVQANSDHWRLEEERDARENRDYVRGLHLRGELPSDRPFRVKLIRTPHFDDSDDGALGYSVLVPFGMGQIASYLRSNGMGIEQDDLHIRLNRAPRMEADVSVFFDEPRILAYAAGEPDAHLEGVFKKIEEQCPAAGYSVVLLSLSGNPANPSGSLFTLAFTKYLKSRYGPIIIAGGPDRDIDALLRYSPAHIDFIGRGRGEKLLFLALSALKHGIPLDRTPGKLLTVDGKELRSAMPPFGIKPDYTGLPMELYQYRQPPGAGHQDSELAAIVDEYRQSGAMVAHHELMEGCFHECSFCACSDTKAVFCLSPRQAVAQLQSLSQEYGFKYFFFLNRLINMSPKFVNDFCDEIIASNLNILWTDCARADNLDKPTLEKMRRAGCVRLIYGLETASPRLLRLIDKRISLPRLEDILRWTHEAGILSGIEIICGLPGEAKDDVQMTIDFLLRNRGYIDFLYPNMLYVEKHSRLYKNPEKYGIENLIALPGSRPGLGSIEIGYDEVNGLKWEDKLQQTRDSFAQLMQSTFASYPNVPYYETEHFMFFLYDKYKDKAQVMEIFKRAARSDLLTQMGRRAS